MNGIRVINELVAEGEENGQRCYVDGIKEYIAANNFKKNILRRNKKIFIDDIDIIFVACNGQDNNKNFLSIFTINFSGEKSGSFEVKVNCGSLSAQTNEGKTFYYVEVKKFDLTFERISNEMVKAFDQLFTL